MEPIVDFSFFEKVTKYYTKQYNIPYSFEDDICSDAYLKYVSVCLKGGIKYPELHKHRKYIAVIIKNKCVDIKRNEYRNVPLDKSLDSTNKSDIEDVVINKIYTLSILDDNDEYEILYLRYIVKLPFKDIAEKLEMNVSTIKTKHHRLLKRLKCK